MIVDCRTNFATPQVAEACQTIKQRLYENAISKADLLKFKESLSTSTIPYGIYLQSFIYFYTHLKSIKEYSEVIIDLLLDEIGENLLTEGDNVWIDEQEGVTILHALARVKIKSDAIPFLFDKIRNLFKSNYLQLLTHKDKCGFTPLNAACKENNETAFYLLEQAQNIMNEDTLIAYIQEKNHYGFTAISSVTTNHLLLEKLITTLPIAIRANYLEIPTKFKTTALFNVCLHGTAECAKILLDHGADWKKNQNGSTSLIIAAQTNQSEIVSLILNHLVTDEGSEEEKKYYLLNETKEYGDTAFAKACFQGNKEIARQLLDAANTISELCIFEMLTKKNKKGESSIEVSFMKKNINILDLISSYAFKNKPFKTACENYTSTIFWSKLEAAQVSLLYQAKVHLEPQQFMTLLSQKRNRKTLLETVGPASASTFKQSHRGFR